MSFIAGLLVRFSSTANQKTAVHFKGTVQARRYMKISAEAWRVSNSPTVSIFVPVLVLVIIEISQAAREFDLIEIARSKQEPFFYSVFYLLDQSSQELISIPQLGPFNFIHGMNLGIIYLGYTLTITTSTGSVRVITALFVYLFWVVFPIIEVNEYVAIMDDPDEGPISFLFHAIVTTVAAVFIYFYGSLINEPVELLRNELEIIGFITICVFLYYISLLGFLALLERELGSTDGTLHLLK